MKKVIVKMSTENKERTVKSLKVFKELLETRNISYVLIDNVVTWNMNKVFEILK